MVLNIGNYFHKIVIKVTGLRGHETSKMVNFHEKMTITQDGMV